MTKYQATTRQQNMSVKSHMTYAWSHGTCCCMDRGPKNFLVATSVFLHWLKLNNAINKKVVTALVQELHLTMHGP